MLKIGSIAYKDELVNHTRVEYINYFDFKNGSNNLNIPTDIPILFVGWNHFKEELNHFHENVTILNKEISKNSFYWEFSFNENKAQHVSGVDMFIRNAPYYYFRDKYTYINIDPIFNNIEHLEDIKEKILGKPEYIYNYKDEMLYLLISNRVYGIDLKMYEYFNMDINHIKSTLIDTSINYTLDLEGEIYQKEYKNYPNFEELKRYLVVLLSKG